MPSPADARPRVLMTGPLPPPAGGTTVLFEALATGLAAAGEFNVEVVGTGGIRGRGVRGVSALLGLAAAIWRGTRRADVVALHLSTTAMHILGPLVALTARLHGTPLIIRKFGGSSVFDLTGVRRALATWAVRRSRVYLAETKQLVEQARAEGLEQVDWYPNSRQMPELAPADEDAGRRCGRFVYLGQIRGEKGVRELVKAAAAFPDGMTVDLYGLTGFDVEAEELAGLSQLSYRGAVPPEEVHSLLLSYDALVFPSYYSGEGHPGVLLEAYAAGLPVVATRWRAVPEVVDDTTGILVEPRDAGSLRDAMLELHNDPDLYSRLRAGVMARRGDFSAARAQERFSEFCRELIR